MTEINRVSKINIKYHIMNEINGVSKINIKYIMTEINNKYLKSILNII